MRKNMKKILISALCVSSLVLVMGGVGVNASNTAVAKAEEPVALAITGKTLTVSNNINVSFLVPVEAGDKNDIKVKVVEKEAEGDVEVTLSASAENYTYKGQEYFEYMYKGVAANEMANELYAYAYLESDNSVQSAEVKYSILQYAYKNLGIIDANKKDASLEELLTTMLAYGSAAAKFTDDSLPADFSYETAYTYVSLENATFADGYNFGLFKKGETVTVTPNEGYTLSNTADSFFVKDGETVTLTVPNDTYISEDAFVDNSANVSDEDKVAHELGLVAFDNEAVYYVDDVVELNAVPERYEDVTITWSAENATVESNVVAFDTEGTATLTATVACGDVSETVSFNVTVDITDAAKVAYEKALIAFNTTEVNEGSSSTLDVTPDKYNVTITWEAENATVSENKVTFDKSGTAKLKATVVCGAAVDYTDWFEVNVKASEKTVSVKIGDYASKNSWSNGVAYETLNMNNDITVTASKGGNNGKYYSSGTNWRMYQSDKGTFTISAVAGKTIKTVKVTYTNSNSGVVVYNSTQYKTDTVITVNAGSIKLEIGNTGSATNGQVRITAIEVVYI